MQTYTKLPLNQHGQSLPIYALMLTGLVVFALALITYFQMLAMAQFTQETAKFAAEIAARPSGERLAGNRLEIDEVQAKAVIEAELYRALDQASGVRNATKQDIINDVVVDILNPVPGICEQFPDDSRCFHTPAVRVTLTIPFNFMGVPVTIRRSGIATTSPTPGDSGSGSGNNGTATPIGFPTQEITAVPGTTNTPVPTATNTPVIGPPATLAPTATNTPAIGPPATNTPVPTATNTPFWGIPRPTATPTGPADM